MDSLAASLADFLFACPTPFHTVEQAKCILLEAGFCPLDEQDSWLNLRHARPGQGFFCVRGGSLVAWICGSAPIEKHGLYLAAAHTDSPCFKLKLEGARFEYGILTCPVSVYGSPIFATHVDRSLAVAGIAVTSDRESSNLRYVHSEQAMAIVPNLAIHLHREINSKLSYNAQTQLKAIFGRQPVGLDIDKEGHVSAVELLREKLGLFDYEIGELQLCSSQKPEQIGLEGEFFSGARLDDMVMVYLLLDEFRHYLSKRQSDSNKNSRQGRDKNSLKWPVAIFCNGEEIGSSTYEGAASNFVSSVLERLISQVGWETLGTGSCPAELVAHTMARSFLLSLDGAHASHPCYPDALDPSYNVNLGGGAALKLPNGASYSSEPFSISYIDAITRELGVPLQKAVPRSDKPTGSTIGPILSSRFGVRGVDIGLPMYAMHSIQETISLDDYISLQKLVHGLL